MNTLILSIALSSPSAEPTFVVENKCSAPQQINVVNKITQSKASVQTVATYKAPVGHTHTCANGHTWDHETNPTHTCQICGLTQFNQDTAPRMVGTLQQYSLTQSTYSSSGCVGGNCPTPSSSSRGNWYPGKFLGR